MLALPIGGVAGMRGEPSMIDQPLDPQRLPRSPSNTVDAPAGGEEMAALVRSLEKVLSSLNNAIVMLDTEWRYTYVNEPAARMMGRPRTQLIGVNFWDVFAEADNLPFAHELRAAVASQQDRVFESYIPSLGRWFEHRVYVSPTGVTLFSADQSDRKQAELNREFLAELTAQLSLQQDPAAILQTATSALGPHLNVTRCYFCELDAAADQSTTLPEGRQADLRSIAGTYPLPRFIPAELQQRLGRGETIVVEDTGIEPCTAPLTQGDAAGSPLAFIAVPYVSEGQLMALLVVEHATVRQWRIDEVTLAEAVLRRVWPLVERARVQQALRLSEAKYRALFEHASDAIFIADDDRRYVDANAAACALSGYSRSELIGKSINDLTPPEALPRLDADRQRLLTVPTERQALVAEWQLLRKDGRRVSVEVSARQLPDGRWQAFVRDITERRAAEAALRATEARFRQLADVMPQLIWTCDAQGRLEYVNEQWLTYRQASLAASLQQGMWPFVHPDDYEQSYARWTQALQSGEPYEAEVRLCRADGQYRWHLDRAVPMRDEQGNIQQWFGTSTDIHAQKQSEADARFLAELEECIRYAEASELLLEAALPLIANHLGVDALRFSEMSTVHSTMMVQIWDARRQTWVMSTHALADLSPQILAALQAGQTVVVADTHTDARTAADGEQVYGALGVRAFIAVPLLRSGGWVANLAAVATTPRPWPAATITLVQTVAERLWLAVERLRLDAELRASEANYRFLAEAMPQLVWTAQPDGKLLYCNRYFCEITGLTPAQALGGDWDAVIHPEDRQPRAEWWEEVRASGKGDTIEYRLLQAATGEYAWFLERIQPVYDEAGALIRWIATAVNISERKWAELALRESEDRFRIMADTAPVLIWLSGQERGCTFFNQAWLEFTGRTLAEELGDGWLENVHPEDRERCLTTEIAAYTARQPMELEYRLRRQDGVYRWMLARGVPRLAQDGSFIGYIGSCIDITERKAVEQQSAFYAYLLENMQDAVIATATDYTITAWNRGAEELYGWQAHEVIGRDVRTFIRTANAEEQHPQHRQLVDRTGRHRFETIHARQDQRLIDVESVTVALHQADKLIGYLSINRDISERKQTEEALRRANERFVLAESASNGFVYEWDLQGDVVERSPNFATMLGYAPEAIQSTAAWWQGLLHPEDAARGAAAAGNHDAYSIEYRVRHANGHYLHLWDRGRIIRSETGEPVRVIGSSVDITARKRTEAALRASEELARRQLEELQAIYASAPVGLAVVDTDLRYVRLNQTLADINGLSIEEHIGRTVRELMPQVADKLEKVLREVIDTGKPLIGLEVSPLVPRPSGESYVCLQSFYPLRDSNNQVIGLNAVVLDITERKRLEQELRHLNATLERQVEERTAELQRSNRELDQFAYVASHDLKAPLRAIQHLATWLSQDAAAVLPPASQAHLVKLQGRIKRMEALLDDLLTYSRAGRHRHPPERIELDALVRNVVDLLATPSGFSVTVAQTADQPVAPFVTERVPLETVFRNLLGNAIKHHDQPSAGQVTITAQDLGDVMEFAVSDNGPGIDPAFHERIFDIFQTLKPRDQVEGSGIGLTVVKKLVESRGGSIRVESALGQGASFHFTWPK
jgi:PAS domain S-box-containing protein